MNAPFTSVEQALEDVRAGRMVVVCDAEDRENEGDIVMAAQFATPEAIDFMAREARGLICLALTPERCDELGARDVQSLLLEGGPHLAGAFLDAGEVDEMRVFVAAIVAGGRQARSSIEGQGFQLIGAARRALVHEVEEIGDDVLITARLAEW